MSACLISIRDLVVKRSSAKYSFELYVDFLDIFVGDRVAFVGPSGCGKSTLLDVLAFVLMPEKARAFTFYPPGGEPIDIVPLMRKRKLDELGRIRRVFTGYVLQTGGLLPFVNVRRNIELPLLMQGKAAQDRSEELAKFLEVGDQLDKMPSELSAGERQRVSIARALVHSPKMVLADEPTAALDPKRSDSAMELFVAIAKKLQTALIVATHDVGRVDRFDLRPLRHEFIVSSQPATTASKFMM